MTTQMQYFIVPVRAAEESSEAINKFLRSVRPLKMDRQFFDQGENSFWVHYIEYLGAVESSAGSPGQKRSQVDYKDVLSDEDFQVYSRLREWRNEKSVKEDIKAYHIFKNVHLAAFAQNRTVKKEDMAEVNGVGKGRIDKYGDEVIRIVTEVGAMHPQKKGTVGSGAGNDGGGENTGAENQKPESEKNPDNQLALFDPGTSEEGAE